MKASIAGVFQLVILGVSLSAVPSLRAQSTDSTTPGWFGGSFGVLWVESGDAGGFGFSLGVAARTQGEWFVSMGMDLLASLTLASADSQRLREYQGDTVVVFSDPNLPLAPRVSLRAGRRFGLAGLQTEADAGFGLIGVRADLGTEEEVFWSRWMGVGFAVRIRESAYSLQFDYGWRDVPFRYAQFRHLDEVVRQFEHTERILSLSVKR